MKKIFCIYFLPFILLYIGCEKEKTIPSITTSPIISITDTAIIIGGTVNDIGQSEVFNRGVCWDTLPNPTIKKLKTSDGKGAGNFTSVIKSFLPNTKYYVRAYASNTYGTAYGQEIVFDTKKTGPVVSTGNAALITSSTVNINGNIIHNGGEEIISYGICWSKNPNPSISENKMTYNSTDKKFQCNLTGLSPYTVYFARAFAENSLGISYGSEISFKTRTEITVTDYDGNIYNTCIIGTRVLMMENLKVLHYRNGDPISHVPNGLNWDGLSTGAYCFYDNDTTNKNIYGALYNWYAVGDNRGLAPEGWHILTNTEWNSIYTYLGGNKIAAGKMKVYGANYYSSFNTNATNESNFSALPNGMRFDSGSGHFQGITGGAFFWGGNQCISCSSNYAHSIWLSDQCYFYADDKRRGFAVRCIKD